MNMPYISLRTAFQVIDEVVNEYDEMLRNGKSSEEKHVGRIGVTATLKIKKSLLKEIKKRERSFD
tara:strand:- start:474 stop:668 length:195 start_codon:yes stop_codon:yes gene_type:complete